MINNILHKLSQQILTMLLQNWAVEWVPKIFAMINKIMNKLSQLIKIMLPQDLTMLQHPQTLTTEHGKMITKILNKQFQQITIMLLKD